MDLDRLKKDIEAHLDANGIATFFGLSRIPNDAPLVVWDVELHPGFQEYVGCAKALGIRMIHLHERILTQDSWDEVEASVEAFDSSPSERADLERRLKALEPYIGFLAGIELTFDFEGRVYVFETRAEFFDEFLELNDEVDLLGMPPFMQDDEDDDDDEEPRRPTGFFSRN